MHRWNETKYIYSSTVYKYNFHYILEADIILFTALYEVDNLSDFADCTLQSQNSTFLYEVI